MHRCLNDDAGGADLLLCRPLCCCRRAGALNQQQLAGMNMAQMQMMQPMGAAGAGMTAAGVHPGVAGQGMMWPMQQANLAQYMQQQQPGNPTSSQPPAG